MNHVHLTYADDDRVLSKTEVAAQEVVARKLRKEQPTRTRIAFWVMDRAYFKALRAGRPAVRARDDASTAYGTVKGVIIGVVTTLVAVGIIGYFTDLLLTATRINLFFSLLVWVVVIMVVVDRIRKFLAKHTLRLAKALWAKVRKVDPETSP